MTFKTCKNKIDYFINEAKYLRCTVLTLDGPAFCMDTKITDERFDIFQKNRQKPSEKTGKGFQNICMGFEVPFFVDLNLA